MSAERDISWIQAVPAPGAGQNPDFVCIRVVRCRTPAALLQGTLDMLILKTLSRGVMHGYAVAETIRANSADVLRVEEGALYPALHRLEVRGWLASEWGVSDNNRRAKYYRLTPAGRKHLSAQTSEWLRLSGAVARLMEI
jgi:PadR family transcriptional regulator PadR